MAFEAFRAQSEAPARGGRKRLWYALSIAVHGALIAAGIAYSFWHIEELSPPLLKVTFMSAAPPPPPAPPPPAGGGDVDAHQHAVDGAFLAQRRRKRRVGARDLLGGAHVRL